MAGKRHAPREITGKLAQANELAAKGKTQREISKALGVSIMTYHRWKKMQSAGNGPVEDSEFGQAEVQSKGSSQITSMEKIKRLELENTQLRRIVTDVLLDKLMLEDELGRRHQRRPRRPEKR